MPSASQPTGNGTPLNFATPESCADGVMNLNGVLSCQSGIIPPGSYLSTCTDFNLHGTTLKPVAATKKEQTPPLSCAMPTSAPADIANKNGSFSAWLEKSAEKKDDKKDDKKRTRNAAYGLLSTVTKLREIQLTPRPNQRDDTLASPSFTSNCTMASMAPAPCLKAGCDYCRKMENTNFLPFSV